MSWPERVCGALVAVLLLAGGLAAAMLPEASGQVRTVASQRPTNGSSSTVPTIVTLDGPDETIVTIVPATVPGPVTTLFPATTVTTVKRVATPRITQVAAPQPAPAPAPAPVAPAPGAGVAERCVAARQWVADQGLALPDGWDYRCPDPAVDPQGNEHWGIACSHCNGGSYVGINMALIGSSEATLRYVVAHEICHAIEYDTLGLSTEITADLCAALHGAPRP